MFETNSEYVASTTRNLHFSIQILTTWLEHGQFSIFHSTSDFVQSIGTVCGSVAFIVCVCKFLEHLMLYIESIKYLICSKYILQSGIKSVTSFVLPCL